MIKTVKKLKFWSRKKRKKKTQQPYYPPPPPSRPPPRPPPLHHCSCSYASSSHYPIQPSAPPLPPWLDADYTHDNENHGTLLEPKVQPAPEPEVAYHPGPSQQESTTPLPYSYPTSSYQQYMVSDPAYGIPVAQTPRVTTGKRSAAVAVAGVFGCVVEFGIRLFRCFCPCFHIREVILQ